jgi:hypothetical protein
MLQNNREADQNFEPEEELFIRFKIIHEDKLIPIEIKSVNQSINRSKHGCQPEWVLLPCYKNWGYGAFKVRDIPTFMTTSAGVRYNFQVDHVPLELNYCHSEIHVYKDRQLQNRINNAKTKADFKMELYEKIEIRKLPD